MALALSKLRFSLPYKAAVGPRPTLSPVVICDLQVSFVCICIAVGQIGLYIK